jgi:hypothetical protein
MARAEGAEKSAPFCYSEQCFTWNMQLSIQWSQRRRTTSPLLERSTWNNPPIPETLPLPPQFAPDCTEWAPHSQAADYIPRLLTPGNRGPHHRHSQPEGRRR